MALPLKKTIYGVYLIVLLALTSLLVLGGRQYQVYQQHEKVIGQTERLIFQFSIIREHVAEALLDCANIKLAGISSEMEQLNKNLTDILADNNIRDEYKLTFFNSIDLPGIILLLRRVESGGKDSECVRNLNREMRTLGERLIIFDRLLVNSAKQRVIGFQNIIIGSTTLVVLLLIATLVLFHRRLIVPMLALVRFAGSATNETDFSMVRLSGAREINELADLYASLFKQLREQREKMSRRRSLALRLLELLDGFLVTLDEKGAIRELTPSLARKVGVTEKELVGQGWRDLFLPRQTESEEGERGALALPENCTAHGGPYGLIKQSDSGQDNLVARCAFVREEDDGRSSIVCLGVDLSRETTRIETLEQAIEEEKNRKTEMVRISHLAILGEIATGVAREVGNLSNGIINYAQLLADAACDPDLEVEREKLFGKIILEGEKIAALAGNLLAYGQDDAQSRELAQVRDVLKNALSLMEHCFRIDGTRIEADLDAIPDCRVAGRQMQQVFLHILTNARRALNERYPHRDDRKRLSISSAIDGAGAKMKLRLTITDYGVGISEEHLGKVFDPSFSTKPGAEGMGMGLAVSRELVLRQQGSIQLESRSNQYTSVIIELPV